MRWLRRLRYTVRWYGYDVRCWLLGHQWEREQHTTCWCHDWYACSRCGETYKNRRPSNG